MEGKGGEALIREEEEGNEKSAPAAPHVHRLHNSADVDLGSERQKVFGYGSHKGDLAAKEQHQQHEGPAELSEDADSG